MKTVLGVDVSKAKFDVALLHESGKFRSKVFCNSEAGFLELDLWLAKQGATKIHACMEATGIYHEKLAYHLHEAGHVVSVVNPVKIKGYAQSELSRSKTDKVDARLIASFCAKHEPEPWQPTPVSVTILQSLVVRHEALIQMLGQEKNRLDIATDATRPSIERIISTFESEVDHLRQQIRSHIDDHPDLKARRELLESVDGIGEVTISRFLAVVIDPQRFDSARSLAAFLGLTPTHRVSGSSVKGRSKMSKAGNARFRKALFFPAMVAIRYNPVVREFAERLAQAGKSKKLIIGAAMRKLVHIMYGVLRSGKPFNPKIGLAYA